MKGARWAWSSRHRLGNGEGFGFHTKKQWKPFGREGSKVVGV